MEQDLLVEKTAEFVRSRLGSDSSGHDWWHTFRVWRVAKHICDREGGDSLIVELAALLHDIADYKLHGGDLEIGPRETAKWLHSLHAPAEVVDRVTEVVRGMGFKGGDVTDKRLDLEGTIVRDADRIDAIGAIGIARTFAFAGFKGELMHDPDILPKTHGSFEDYKNKNSTAINHFFEKLLLLKDRLHTQTGREIAEKRHRFLKLYLDQFFSEWNADLS